MPALLTERDGHSLIVTLNRPERQNAINGEMLVRLYDACVEADTDPDIRTLILTGAGLDAGTAGFVVALDGNIRDGVLGTPTADLATLIGRPTTPLAQYLAAAV